MGNHEWQRHDGEHSGAVKIVDLGESASQLPLTASMSPAERFRHPHVVIGVVAAAALLLVQVSLPAAAEPVRGADQLTADPGRACIAAASATDDEAVKIPPGYSRYGIMTSHTDFVQIGLLRPDGLVESCEDQGQLAAHGVTFNPRADELCPLSDGASYVYASGKTKNGMSLKLAGTRAEDGSVTKYPSTFDAVSIMCIDVATT